MTRRSAIVLAVFAVVGIWLAVSVYLFEWPSDDRVRRSDAIVVLGPGPHGERLRTAKDLLRRHLAPRLVASVPDTQRGWVELRAMCSEGRAICFRAHPFNTRGEARHIARLARRNNWKSLIVVTSRYHVVRARLLNDRCFDGELMVVGARAGHRPVEVAKRTIHEWGGLLDALTLERGC